MNPPKISVSLHITTHTHSRHTLSNYLLFLQYRPEYSRFYIYSFLFVSFADDDKSHHEIEDDDVFYNQNVIQPNLERIIKLLYRRRFVNSVDVKVNIPRTLTHFVGLFLWPIIF